jgi:hypothetical protein
VLQDPVHTVFTELSAGTKVGTFSPASNGQVNPFSTNSVAISRDRSRAIVTNNAGTLQVYDLTTVVPTLLRTHAEAQYPEDVDITADGRFAVLQDPVHTVFFELGSGAKWRYFRQARRSVVMTPSSA